MMPYRIEHMGGNLPSKLPKLNPTSSDTKHNSPPFKFRKTLTKQCGYSWILTLRDLMMPSSYFQLKPKICLLMLS